MNNFRSLKPLKQRILKKPKKENLTQATPQDVLAALGRELSVSKSRDLGDYLTTLRNATPDPVTLLTHQDRMSQLDLESRGGCLQIGLLTFNMLFKIFSERFFHRAFAARAHYHKQTLHILTYHGACPFVVCPRNL